MIESINTNNLDELNNYLENNNLLKVDPNELKLNPFLKIFVYRNSNSIVGYLNYSIMYDKAELNQIYISESYRNCGLGTLLLRNFIDNCRECGTFTLEVNENNHAAIHLYEKLNFITVAVRKQYYGRVNGLLMMYKRGE